MRKTILSIILCSIFLTNPTQASESDESDRSVSHDPTRTGVPLFLCTHTGGPFDSQALRTMGATGFVMQPVALDPAIHHYTPQVVVMRGATLNQLIEEGRSDSARINAQLVRVNSLELAGCKEATLRFLANQADLSTMRTIEASGVTDLDSFLSRLFQNNATLRSLTKLSVVGSDLKKETLKILRDDTSFNGPLIRDMWKISGRSGMKVANITVIVAKTFASDDELEGLEIPSQRMLDILYRGDYSPGSAAHIQLQFE